MFEQTFVEGKTKKTWTVLVAFLAQTAFLIIAVILPMIYFDVLPKTTLTMSLVAPPPPPPPPPPPAPAAAVKIVKVIPRQFDAGRLMAPKSVPKEIVTIKEEDLPPASSGGGGVVGGVAGGVAGGAPGGVLGGIIGSVPTAALPPPPPPPVKVVEKLKRITIGGNVQQAKLVRQPKPVYPPLAKQARISGVVHLAAIISKDGTIMDLKVISGHPLLIPSALEAVKQWVYQPTLLNGEPVEVSTQIDVNFTLSQ
jgi:periplasmic protein TonB